MAAFGTEKLIGTASEQALPSRLRRLLIRRILSQAAILYAVGYLGCPQYKPVECTDWEVEEVYSPALELRDSDQEGPATSKMIEDTTRTVAGETNGDN